MFSKELLLELFRHMEWADSHVWAAVPQDAPPDARLHGLLLHMHMTQHAFYAIWTGADVSAVFRKPEDLPTMAAVREWARGYYAGAHRHVSDISDDHINRPVKMPWADMLTERLGRPPGPTTFAETCFQVTSHSAYHRGQINARLREIGIEPPLVDYIAWLWHDRPRPVWAP